MKKVFVAIISLPVAMLAVIMLFSLFTDRDNAIGSMIFLSILSVILYGAFRIVFPKVVNSKPIELQNEFSETPDARPENKEKIKTENELDHKRDEEIELLFKGLLELSPYIKSESHQRVIEHLTHKASLHKTGNTLSVEEKKTLGVNTKVSFTKEFIDVLTKEGLELQNPKIILSDIYNKVTIEKSIRDNFKKAVNAGMRRFTLESTGGGDPCEWCISNAEKEFGPEILDVLNKNCSCKPYTWSYISPIVEFDD